MDVAVELLVALLDCSREGLKENERKGKLLCELGVYRSDSKWID